MPADPDEARRLAEEILSQPEFQPPSEAWWQTALGWVQERIARLLGTLVGGGTGQVFGWLVVVAVLAAVTFLVVQLVRGRRGREGSPASGAAEPASGEPDVDWQAEATRLEAAGRWREGMRARYRALVARLSTRGAVDPGSSHTTGDHRAEVASRAPAAGAAFDDAAELFDRAWYGGRSTGADEARRFAELADTVEETAR